jgi:hypothetical protein
MNPRVLVVGVILVALALAGVMLYQRQTTPPVEPPAVAAPEPPPQSGQFRDFTIPTQPPPTK